MKTPILVVGAGPTGLTAALELSRFGIPIRIVEKQLAPPTTSRAIGIQARTLDLLRQRGLSDELLRLGNPAQAGSVYAGGKRLFRFDFTRIDSRYNFLLFVSQAETEQVLRSAAESQGVSIEYGVKLTGFSQDSNSVKAVLRHRDGHLEEAHASWLISAEGAHSTVRATLGLPFEGKTLDELYILGDLHVDGELSDSEFHIFSSEHGFMALFPMGGRRFRLMASHPVREHSKAAEPTLQELQIVYEQRSHIPVRFRNMSWSSWFRINSRMVSRLRVGRLFLGGDAAHIHSPAGAQGMNTGIQDMINLGWKLALVEKKYASPDLLDTYELERLPIMRNVLKQTETLMDLIGSESRWTRSLFSHVSPWIGNSEFVQKHSSALISQLAIQYRGSPLSSNHSHGGKLRAGDRLPDLRVRYRRKGDAWKEGSVHDLLDPARFVILSVEPKSGMKRIPPMPESFKFVSIAQARTKEDFRRFRTIFGSADNVFLVRPDGYIGLASGPSHADQYLNDYFNQWWVVPPKHHAKAAA